MDTPKSPNETQKEDEVLLFIEDRRPGRVSPVRLIPHLSEPKPVVVVKQTEDFIRFSGHDKVGGRDLKNDEVDSSNNEESSNNATGVIKQSENLLFVIEDRNPILTGQETQSPKYKINDSFLKLQGLQSSSSKKNRLANTCWNCGDTSHALRDCKEPRNHAQISKSRKEFQESKASTPVYKRYHKEESQNFAHLVPGEPSEELRRAMGLDARQLPAYIYMMRILGYPPGWLKEATVSHSGISMFDGQGREVAPEGKEVGEVIEQGSLDKYDMNKIIRFPGFNVPPPPDTYDDSGYWRCPPMSQRQSIEAMCRKLNGRIVGGYKRKKMSANATVSELDDTLQSAESQDMEYEETPEGAELPEDNCKFVPPLPEEELPPPPPTELPEEPSEADNDSSIDDASLIDLEEEKMILLTKLNDMSPEFNTPNSRIGKIKSMDLGTPILESVSPYARLPSAEKFSVNICDVINFENLPDSTGKYEKMSGIIRKVRTKLCKMNNEL